MKTYILGTLAFVSSMAALPAMMLGMYTGRPMIVCLLMNLGLLIVAVASLKLGEIA